MSSSDSFTTTVDIPATDITPQRKLPTRVQNAWADLQQGICRWQIWWLLGWQDIRLRYRRSQLGPFWITCSMAITILAMGFLYSRLFHLPLQEYFPFLTAGMLIWNLLSTLITDSANTFIEAESYLKQIRLPYTAFVLRAICRSFIIFAHNIVVLIPVLFFFHVKIDWSILMELPALLIIIGTAFGYGLLLAMLGARYRDIAQIVASLMQVCFFITPVIWSPAALSPHGQFLIQFNPFLQFVTLLRAPLLGIMPGMQVWVITLGIMLIGWALALALFTRVRHRIVYWL